VRLFSILWQQYEMSRREREKGKRRANKTKDHRGSLLAENAAYSEMTYAGLIWSRRICSKNFKTRRRFNEEKSAKDARGRCSFFNYFKFVSALPALIRASEKNTYDLQDDVKKTYAAYTHIHTDTHAQCRSSRGKYLRNVTARLFSATPPPLSRY